MKFEVKGDYQKLIQYVCYNFSEDAFEEIFQNNVFKNLTIYLLDNNLIDSYHIVSLGHRAN